MGSNNDSHYFLIVIMRTWGSDSFGGVCRGVSQDVWGVVVLFCGVGGVRCW